MLSKNLESKIPAYADIIFDVMSFAGGMNTRSSQLFLSPESKFALRPDQCTIIDNMIRTSTGALVTRPGRTRLNATPISPPAGDAIIRSLFELKRSDGTNRIVINAGNTIYRYDSGSGGFVSIGTVALANQRMNWCQHKEVLVGTDGTNNTVQYDGTTLSDISGAPTGPAIAAHRNRVFIGKNKSLYYCALGDHTDWTSPNNAGVVPIPVTKGAGCTALLSLWDRLIVFCGAQVFQLLGTGPNSFEMVAINLTYGHEASPIGVAAAGNDIYFASSRGAHSMSVTMAQSVTGDVGYRYASGIIEPTWQSLNSGNIANICAVHDSKHSLVMFLCSQTSVQNTQALVADYYHLDQDGQPTWTRYNNYPFACGTEVTSLNGYPEVVFGGYDGHVYVQDDDAEDDTGGAIGWTIQYVTDIGMPAFEKLWRHLALFTNTVDGVISMSVSFDFGQHVLGRTVNVAAAEGDLIGSTFVIGESTLGNIAFKQRRVSIPGHGRFMVVNLSGSSTHRITVGGMVIYAGLRRAIKH